MDQEVSETREKWVSLVEDTIQGMERIKIDLYADSLKLPWKQTGKEPVEGEPDPGEGKIWGTDLGKGYGVIKLPYAHYRQRYMTYPWEDPAGFWRFLNSIYYLAFAGNQFGKSVWLACWIIMECLGIHPLQKLTWREALRICGLKAENLPAWVNDIDQTIRHKPPMEWWVVGNELPSQAKIKGGEDTPTVKTFYEWAPNDELVFYRKDKIMLIGDSSVKWFSHDQESGKLKGARVDGIGWDEEPPKSFWNEGKPRLLAKHGIFLLAMTSDYGSWTGELRRQKRDPSYYIGEFDSLENPFMDNGFRNKLLGTMSEQELYMRRFGQDISFQGKVFPFNFNDNVGRPFELSNNNPTCVIIDWHPAKPIVVNFLQVNARNIWYVFDESVISSHIVGDVALDIRSKLGRLDVVLRVKKYIIDKIAMMEQVQETGQKAKDIVQMFREFGIYCETGNPSFGPAHTFLCDKMRHKEFYVDPSCTFTIDQMETWGAKRYQKGNLEGTLRDQLEAEGNDSCINMVYAYNSGFKYLNAVWEEMADAAYEHPRAHSGSRIYGRTR